MRIVRGRLSLALALFLLIVFSLIVSRLQDFVFLPRGARLLHQSAALYCGASDISSAVSARSPPASSNRSIGLEPRYFARIEEHLSPWRGSGITRRSLDRLALGSMRVAILRGRMYVRVYGDCPQSRSVFTLWGLLLLLERFGDRIPDVEFVLNCKDRPIVAKDQSDPAPVLSYCSSSRSLDIPFPDYSFWGWPEVNIHPWEKESEQIFQEAQSVLWTDRQPVAFWKGNSHMGNARKNLIACNSSEFNTLIYEQNWIAEANSGYLNSKLANQCQQRYNIYTDGAAWSASLKYKMACGSTLLYVNSEFQEFFTEGLVPNVHFVPVSSKVGEICEDIKRAVAWGNSHPHEAQAIGKNGQDFMKTQVNIDNVYNYMFHLLSRYAALQRFSPKIPKGGKLFCKRAVEYTATNSGKHFYMY